MRLSIPIFFLCMGFFAAAFLPPSFAQAQEETISPQERERRVKENKIYISYSSPQPFRTLGGTVYCKISYRTNNWTPKRLQRLRLNFDWPQAYDLDVTFDNVEPGEKLDVTYSVPSENYCNVFNNSTTAPPSVSARDCRMPDMTDVECASKIEYRSFNPTN